MKLFFTVTLIICSLFTNGQNRLKGPYIDNLEMYQILGKIYNVENYSESDMGKKIIDWYTYEYNKTEYLNNNNEFRLKDYLQRTKNKAIKAMENYSFLQQYSVTKETTFGEYDFDKKAFPIKLNIDGEYQIKSQFDGKGGAYFESEQFLKADIIINNFINYIDYFEEGKNLIAVSNTAAENFLSKNPNRKLTLRYIFSFVKQRNFFVTNDREIYLSAYIHKIEVLDNNYKIIKTIASSFPYDDKIQGFKKLNGVNKYYIGFSLTNPSFYPKDNGCNTRIEFEMKDGKIVSSVKYIRTESEKLVRQLDASYFFPTFYILDGNFLDFSKNYLNSPICNPACSFYFCQYSNGYKNGYEIFKDMNSVTRRIRLLKYENDNMLEDLTSQLGKCLDSQNDNLSNHCQYSEELKSILISAGIGECLNASGNNQKEVNTKSSGNENSNDNENNAQQENTSRLGAKQREILDKINETHKLNDRVDKTSTINSFQGKYISSECKKGYFEFVEVDKTNSVIKTNRRNCINLLGNEKLNYQFYNGILFYEIGNYTKNGILSFNVNIVFIDSNKELVVVNYATTDIGNIRATERIYKKE